MGLHPNTIEKIRVGQKIGSSGRTINQIIDCLRAMWPTPGGSTDTNGTRHGTTYGANKARPSGSAAVVAATTGAIWKPYQHTPDPEDPQASDWRTIRVTHGLVNNIIPTDTTDPDDPDGDGTDLILAASSIYHFWLECTISTDLDADEGKVTAVALDYGTSWWSGHPNEQNGDSDTGAPPALFFIDLYSITTSNNTDKVLTLPSLGTWSAHNYQVDEISFGNPDTDESGNCIMQKRMTYRAA